MEPSAGLRQFFDEVTRLIDCAERQYGIANRSYAEYVIERLEFCIVTCTDLLDNIRQNRLSLPDMNSYCSSIGDLVGCLRQIYYKWEDYATVLDSLPTPELPQRSRNDGPGRPRFEISKEQLEYLASLSFKWTEIAALLGVSRMTVYRRRIEYGLIPDPLSEISDEDLLSTIGVIRLSLPYSGVSMIWGSLRSRGVKVSRERVRTALQSVDPLSRALRWPAGLTRRQPYSVAGPNSLWHIDSHHKLIRWRMVTHGAIDGYSRLIVYLHCSNNNKASTVYQYFLSAVQKYSLPSRVRSDQGLENVHVGQHMIEKRGLQRRSMITGSSTHNQRIERLWRDLHQSVTILYYKLFYFMEHNDYLDPMNEHHLWALSYVYLPRINKSIREFTQSWNNHPIRTTNHKSPQQLFTAGLLLLEHSRLEALDYFENIDDTYGIDPDGPLSPEEEIQGVEVPESSLYFSDRDLATLGQLVDPCGPSDDYGIDLYEQVLHFIMNL